MKSLFKHNWADPSSAIAAIVSTLLAASGLASDKREKKAEFQFFVDQSYERVWSKHNENPALWRITQDCIDLEKNPVTLEEERFILLLLNHVTSTLKAIRFGVYDKPDQIEEDILSFFAKPIPMSVALKHKSLQTNEIRDLLDKL